MERVRGEVGALRRLFSALMSTCIKRYNAECLKRVIDALCEVPSGLLGRFRRVEFGLLKSERGLQRAPC